MKYITTLILVALFTTTTAQAQLLEAKPAALALETALKAKLKYVETAKVSGYASTSSCLYTSGDLIVIKNYCSPKREYPAKSYTIISAKFGMIQLYQETIDSELLKRDVRIEMFPVYLQKQLKPNLANYKIADINAIMDNKQNAHLPGCWSTNFSFYTEQPDANCNNNNVQDFEQWAAETQKMTSDYKYWATLFENLNEKFKE